MDKRTATKLNAEKLKKQLRVGGELKPGMLMQKVNANTQAQAKKEQEAIEKKQSTIGKGRVLSAPRRVAGMM